jgi:hypothetical protein
MKIYFRNKAARLKRYTEGSNSCKRCPFFKMPADNCPWGTSTIVDCYDQGHWVYGELLDIFKV